VSREFSRKELFHGVFSFLDEARKRTVPGGPARQGKTVRPPGALSPDAAYLAACTGCAACVEACPQDSLFMTEVAGDPPRRVAVLLAERRPCFLCTELPCIAACRDGALRHPGSPAQVRLGVAQVDPLRCRTFRGETCDLCLRFCPLPGEAIREVAGRPVVMPSACTGCGLCAAVCPERPRAITVVPERDLIPGMRLPRDPRSSVSLGG
jgi:ferredoxin-type protein NapG